MRGIREPEPTGTVVGRIVGDRYEPRPGSEIRMDIFQQEMNGIFRDLDVPKPVDHAKVRASVEAMGLEIVEKPTNLFEILGGEIAR